MKIKEENIESLIKDFNGYTKRFYERGEKIRFPNPSDYFHKRVIELIRNNDYETLFESKLFLEFVYATLATWGLDRMDGSARLVKFENFYENILNNLEILKNLSKIKLNELQDKDIDDIKERLLFLFGNMEIMLGKCKLVGVSKTLHHLLPDLVPPIDREYTLNFFYGNTEYNEKNQKDKFLEIFIKYSYICKRLNLTTKNLEKEWDTSVPKLIDNAIIGYIQNEISR